jgi:hypothetical protein
VLVNAPGVDDVLSRSVFGGCQDAIGSSTLQEKNGVPVLKNKSTDISQIRRRTYV